MIKIIGASALNLHKSRPDELICDIPVENMASLHQGETADRASPYLTLPPYSTKSYKGTWLRYAAIQNYWRQ